MDINTLYPVEIVDAFRDEVENKRINGGMPWKEVTILAKNGKSIPTRFSGTVLNEKGNMMGSVAFFSRS
jgi:hypothetical protein